MPDDCAIIGFDNIQFSDLITPALTTVHVDKYELGCQAMDLLVRMLDDSESTLPPVHIDVELVVRDSLKEWLEEDGFAVDMAESGAAALDQLAQKSYQLMLLDIKMPGMDGVEVLQKAKEDFPDLGVVMMTAYATVETAVEAMKIGALDYLMKPFDPESLIPMVERMYEDLVAAEGRQIEVGAVVLCAGTSFFNPAGGKNTFGYGIYPNVVTNLEFERILSGCGPYQGRLVHPVDGKPLHKIAWIQCVGSRDLQTQADFCSNICCMVAIKEALVAKEKSSDDLETAGKAAAQYHLFDIDRTGSGWTVTMRTRQFDPQSGAFHSAESRTLEVIR